MTQSQAEAELVEALRRYDTALHTNSRASDEYQQAFRVAYAALFSWGKPYELTVGEQTATFEAVSGSTGQDAISITLGKRN